MNEWVAFHNQKCYKEAIARFDKALNIDPRYAHAWSNKGSSLHGLQQCEEAIAWFDKAQPMTANHCAGSEKHLNFGSFEFILKCNLTILYWKR